MKGRSPRALSLWRVLLLNARSWDDWIFLQTLLHLLRKLFFVWAVEVVYLVKNQEKNAVFTIPKQLLEHLLKIRLKPSTPKQPKNS